MLSCAFAIHTLPFSLPTWQMSLLFEKSLQQTQRAQDGQNLQEARSVLESGSSSKLGEEPAAGRLSSPRDQGVVQIGGIGNRPRADSDQLSAQQKELLARFFDAT